MDHIDQILRSAGRTMGNNARPVSPALVSYPGGPARQDRAGWDGAGGIQTNGDRWYDNAGAGGYTYMTGGRSPMDALVGDIMAGGARGRGDAGQQAGCPPEGFAPRQAPGQVVAYSEFQATGGRRFPIGGFRATVAGAGTGRVANAPQLPFRTERLVVPSTIATDFDINDVKVGQASEFVAAGAIPALIFSEQAFDTSLRGDTAYIAMTISIEITNLAGVEKDFSCAIIGTVVRGNLSPRSEGRERSSGL